MTDEVRRILEDAAQRHERTSFVESDPISIPHRFTKSQDIEIAGFFAAILAWGNRTTIINSSNRLMKLMDDAPHDFVVNSTDKERKGLTSFVHRTFNGTDALYLVDFLHRHYRQSMSLESAFFPKPDKTIDGVEAGLRRFRSEVFKVDYAPVRTQKHIATPERGSACKRLNMFLRWMVRPESSGVDFGFWKHISPYQLICPLDVHVHRVALELGIIERRQSDWKTAVELTEQLRLIDSDDPVRFDYALFGLGLEWKRNGVLV